jgi:hypothetical protein
MLTQGQGSFDKLQSALSDRLMLRHYVTIQCCSQQERRKASIFFFFQIFLTVEFTLCFGPLESFVLRFFIFVYFLFRLLPPYTFLLLFWLPCSFLLSLYRCLSNHIILVTRWSHQNWNGLYYIPICISLPFMFVCPCVISRSEIGLWLDFVLEIPLCVTATHFLWANLRLISCFGFKPYIVSILRNVQKLKTRKEFWDRIST